ncbi:MAG: hypothetical protein ACTSUE_05955 [Promethearchaeota archaeon]
MNDDRLPGRGKYKPYKVLPNERMNPERVDEYLEELGIRCVDTFEETSSYVINRLYKARSPSIPRDAGGDFLPDIHEVMGIKTSCIGRPSCLQIASSHTSR